MSKETRRNAIRAENRKALPKFFLVILICAIIGFGIGYLVAYFGDISAGFFAAVLGKFWVEGLIYFPILVMIFFGIPSIVLLVLGRKKGNCLVEEDEKGLEKTETILNAALVFNYLHQMGNFAVLAIFLGAVNDAETWQVFLTVGLFLLSIIWQIILQQKTVDYVKVLYPEKRGSVYSLNFNKKWLQSCDERELMEIYRCGYQGYKAGSTACLILFMVTALGSVPFGYGPIPAGVVLLVWFIMLMGYLKEALKSGRKK